MFKVLLLLLAAQNADQPIRRVLEQQTEAWNRGDIEAFMQGYENAPSTTFVGKSVQRGYQQVLNNYRKRYPTHENMGVLTFSDVEIRPLGQDYASVLGQFHLKRTPAAGGDSNGIFTLLFHRNSSGWKIILDHTS